MDKGRFGGIRTRKPLNRLTQNLVWMIMSALLPHVPNFERIILLGTLWHMGEISCSSGFVIFPLLNFLCPQILLKSADLETKLQYQFLHGLIYIMSIPGYIPR